MPDSPPKALFPYEERIEQLQHERPIRKRLNAAERRAMKSAALQLFVKQVGRKAQKGVEPNDRAYDRKTVEQVRHMPPIELDELLREGEE